MVHGLWRRREKETETNRHTKTAPAPSSLFLYPHDSTATGESLQLWGRRAGWWEVGGLSVHSWVTSLRSNP